MRILSILFVLILGISCTEKVEESKPLIEIYQLNKRIASYEGEPFKFTTERIKFDSIFYNQSKNIARTTDDNNLIINGDFRATSEDLNRTPLISNEQIKGYDFTTNELIVDEEACEYFTIIKKNKDKYPDEQLVLTINKKPILNFYKAGSMSRWDIGKAYYVLDCHDNEMLNKRYHREPGNTNKNTITIYRESFIKTWNENFSNLKQDTAFYYAFKRAGKIIAE